MKKIRTWHISFLSILLIVLVWHLVTYYQLVSPLFLPSPSKVFESFIDIAFRTGYKGASLWFHLKISLLRIGTAFLFAVILAVPLGLLSGFSKIVSAVLTPLLNFYRPLPPLAYYTLLVIWMGIGDLSKISLLFLAGFAPIFISSMSALENIDPNKVIVAKTLGASTTQVFLYVILPASLPEIFAGLRTSLGFIYTTLVAAEMVAAVSGIGWMVLDASKYMQTEVMFVGIIIMGITGIIIDFFLRSIERFVIPWKGKGT